MSEKGNHHKINYIEFHTNDIERSKKFYSTVFGWKFKDWGAEYIDCRAEDSFRKPIQLLGPRDISTLCPLRALRARIQGQCH